MQHEEYVGAPKGALAIPLKARGGGVRAWALVDEADYAWASQYNWHVHDGYARRNVSPRESGLERWYIASMHRELLGLGRGDKRECDHINRNRLDNRRENLRIVTHKQNHHNQGCNKRANRTSEYRGVCWHKRIGKWQAYCRVDGKLKTLGYFTDEHEAGRVAAAYRLEHMSHTTDVAA